MSYSCSNNGATGHSARMSVLYFLTLNFKKYLFEFNFKYTDYCVDYKCTF